MARLSPSPELRPQASPQLDSRTSFVVLNGLSLEVAQHRHAFANHTILLLHEALGSVAYWRDFPEKLAVSARADVLVYSRSGQGNSDGAPSPRTLAAYAHESGEIIPALLARFAVERPIVYGHSEGAGLAMMYAASSQRVRALILESPFLSGMKQSGDHINGLAASYQGSRLQQSLARYHRDADVVFHSWIDGIARLAQDEPDQPAFGNSIDRIVCPVLVLQGEKDEFGTTPHLDALRAKIPHLEFEVLADAGHLPHRQSTEAVLARVTRFVEQNP